ncbi:exported protein of unknown function (plasmid) [Cupriavidus taiwanensis]|uniref:Uncharacterized protein n=1 Tax=Cupriavidus taiwanensis TaxID=164546 RepID=A0A375IR24_9BURK|nr:exported protein of unknown function [Cupriavidus taiwanensis]
MAAGSTARPTSVGALTAGVPLSLPLSLSSPPHAASSDAATAALASAARVRREGKTLRRIAGFLELGNAPWWWADMSA